VASFEAPATCSATITGRPIPSDSAANWVMPPGPLKARSNVARSLARRSWSLWPMCSEGTDRSGRDRRGRLWQGHGGDALQALGDAFHRGADRFFPPMPAAGKSCGRRSAKPGTPGAADGAPAKRSATPGRGPTSGAVEQWVYECSGIVGLDPGPLTLRELVVMADARRKLAWAQTAEVLAMLFNGLFLRQARHGRPV